MLERLYIQNYALIDRMNMEFSPGMNVITGETGTGKSIMLKGLSLILGKRAEKDAIRRPDKKIIVEGHFRIDAYGLEKLFDQYDLDYEPVTVIRREITPSGKSRAFVNDTPVRLDTLEDITSHLIDIHSQHQQLLLRNKQFRFDFVDALSGTREKRETFRRKLHEYRRLREKKERLTEEKNRLAAMADYRAYQLAELEQIDWDTDWDEAEQKLQSFQHQEEILEKLGLARQMLENENYGLLENFRQFKQILSSLASYDKELESLSERAENLMPELNEFLYDLQHLTGKYEWMDMQEKQALETALNRLYDLMRKHQVQTPAELQALYEQWKNENDNFTQLDDEIAETERRIQALEKELETLADQLHRQRAEHIPHIEQQLNDLIAELGMEHSRLKWELTPAETFNEFGKDELKLYLSPDKGKTFGDVTKIASGGELSRIMLAIKYMFSRHFHLPTLVLDEIDAGISGNIARKMASLLQEMSRHMQLIVITHLPQTAAQGDKHFKVFKEEHEGEIISRIKELTPEERIREIAEMVEGKPPSASAMEHAKFLLTRSKTETNEKQ